MPEQPLTPESSENEEWFRAPSPREHRIAGALFIGFGVFFLMLSFVWHDVWFRWVLLALGGYSILVGGRHAFDARKAKKG